VFPPRIPLVQLSVTEDDAVFTTVALCPKSSLEGLGRVRVMPPVVAAKTASVVKSLTFKVALALKVFAAFLDGT
jgi:hypothetical protein